MDKLKKLFTIPTDKLWVYPVFFGTALRLYKLTASSIWHDEGYTMWLLRYNPIQIIERTARDVHPPGYYLIAKPWVMVFGNSEFAIRMLSVIFSIGIIYLVYKIVEKLFNDKAPFWASMFVALSPFMVRFAQEARMYGIVAFFTTLATYFLIKIILVSHTPPEVSVQNNTRGCLPRNLGNYILYVLFMTFAVYTQYYAFFIIMVQWIIVAGVTPGFFKLKWKDSFKKHLGIFNLKWWIAGLVPVILFLPWALVAYKQVTRVGGSYWIKPEWITLRTIPNNLTQFILYQHLDGPGYENLVVKSFYWLLALVLIGSGFLLLYRKDLRPKIAAFLAYGYLPMVLVFILSKVKTPVYQDRYFPFSAVAILALWGILIALVKNKAFRMIVGGLAIVFLIFGNFQMHKDTNHQMKALSETVKKQMQPGDVVLSGELYTFLDGTYYFGDRNLRLISDTVDGYGESSLFYDQQKGYVISKNDLSKLNGRIIVIGKTGDKPYFPNNIAGRSAKTIFEENNRDALKAVMYGE